ncbi:MAG: sulfotransferase [Flavobacteriales bacterium]|jgi:hypothetical protein|nr:MAG: sulfotransferase [Flavobacteriales bacterium]
MTAEREQIDRSEPGSTPVSRIFVIGSPRSGTSWLHRMIAEHPRVASIEGELTVFSRYLAPVMKAYEREKGHMERGEWSQGMPLLYSGQEFEVAMAGLVARIYERLLSRRPDATHVLDKHPDYCHHLPLMERFMPEARYVHIIRDGREVAVSMISAKRRLGYGAGEVEGAAREWQASVMKARAFGAVIGTRYLEVRYEELVSDTAAVLSRVFSHFGLFIGAEEVERIAADYHISRKQVSRGDTSLNALRTEQGAIWRSRLSVKQRFILDRVAGDLLSTLGYAQPGWWAMSIMQRIALLPYPFLLKVKRSIRALLAIWGSPAIRRGS